MIVQIKLPAEAKLIPAENSSIKIGDPLFSIGQEDNVTIQVSEKLGMNPHDIFAAVTVVVGEEVQEGSVVATRKGLVRKKKVHSPEKGTVVHINHETGTVELRKGDQESKEESSYFNGKIVKLDATENVIEVEIKGGVELSADTLQHTGGGPLYYLLDERDYFHINESMVKDNHIVLENVQSQIITKLEALSADGVIFTEGEAMPNFPCIIINEDSFKKLIAQKYKFIVYSSHTNQVVAYN